MDFKNDGMIGNLPKNINKEVPTPNADAKRITKLVKHDGDVVGYELSNGQRVSKDEGIQMAKMGEIAGVDADGCGVVGNGLITDGLDLGPGGLRLQQGMIDMGEDFFTGHIIFLHQFLLARRTFAMPTALRAIAVTDAVAPMMPRTRPETRNAKPFRPRFIIPYLHCFVT